MLRGEAANINVIVFDLTRPRGFEPMIYRIRGMHANYYSVKAVICLKLFIVYMPYTYILVIINHVHGYNRNEICCNMKTKYQYNHLTTCYNLKRNQQHSVYSWDDVSENKLKQMDFCFDFDI